MSRPLAVRDEGLLDYRAAHILQQELLSARRAGGIPDTLLLCEHPRVITLGRSSKADAVLDPTVPVVEIERGGQATYHAPGQLVGYPIVHLDERGRDLRRYLRELEGVLIAALEDLGVASFRREGLTGVWTDRGKIASIGIAVRRWVSWHGFALNLDNDPAEFACIRPCGLTAADMTSLRALRGAGPWLEAGKAAVVARFRDVFGRFTPAPKARKEGA